MNNVGAAGGRVALVAAAERLFAEQGIDVVSLRAVARAGGHRNPAALQYHFGNRTELVRAIVAKHAPPILLSRAALLDQLDRRVDPTLRDVVDALIQPLADRLAEPDGGPAFLQVAGELVRQVTSADELDDDSPLAQLFSGSSGSIERWAEYALPFIPPVARAEPFHRRFDVVRFVHDELGHRARSVGAHESPLFVSQLADLASAMVVAPVSATTLRLARRSLRHSKKD